MAFAEWTKDEAGLIERARGLAPLIRECRESIERERKLPRPLVEAMDATGIFQAYVPRELGGLEVRPHAMIESAEWIAREDGSAAWIAVICGSQGLYLSRLAPKEAHTILGAGGHGIAGSLSPEGRGAIAPGGYQVSGRWRFASGCDQSAWLMAPAVLMGDDGPLRNEQGLPRTRVMLLPKEQCTVLDTWDVGGLKGTGSHDFTVDAASVPEEYSFDQSEPGRYAGAMFRLTVLQALAGIQGVCFGLARGAIAELVRLAAEKRPLLSRSALRERPAVQLQVAEAEALVSSAKAWVKESLDETMAGAEAGRPSTLDERIRRRLSAWHAAQSSARAVRLMYEASGTTGIYTSSPLERAFRDVHVATQHVTVSAAAHEASGRALLGLEPGSPLV